jgi:hypothetical protein
MSYLFKIIKKNKKNSSSTLIFYNMMSVTFINSNKILYLFKIMFSKHSQSFHVLLSWLGQKWNNKWQIFIWTNLRFPKHKNQVGISCLQRNTFPNLCIFLLLIMMTAEVYINFKPTIWWQLRYTQISYQTTVFYFKKGNMIINWISVLII